MRKSWKRTGICLFMTITLLLNCLLNPAVAKADDWDDDMWEEDYVDPEETESPMDPYEVSDHVFLLDVVCENYESVRISWRYISRGLEIFEIYRSESMDGYSTMVGAQGSDAQYDGEELVQEWTDTTVELGKTYYYTIRTRYYNTDGESIYDRCTETKGVEIVLGQTVLTKVESLNETTISVQWTGLPGATHYEIYRSGKADGEFQKVDTVSGELTGKKDSGLTLGNTYFYKVRAYRETENGIFYAEESEVLSAMVVYAAPEIKEAKILKADRIQLSWTKNSKGSGYEIYRASDRDAKLTYKKIKTLSKNTTCSVQIKKLTNGVTYYYKVRVIGKKAGQKLEGNFSARKKRLMNVYAYDWETYEQRVQRIFKKKGYQYYKSDKSARADMKTIAIKVWDFQSGSSGKKITKTKYLTVHKNIAGTVQKIFEEIYKGKEKFPIHEIGGYSWRGNQSQHCLGLAIDINSNENCMIEGKKVLVGSFWRPNKNPYSIPTDGEVAQIMQKYGFYQGLWGERRDYMHFSYFGV